MSQETKNLINLQDLNLVDDEASIEGTRALRFVIQRVQQAKQNPLLQPTLQSLFTAHDLVLHDINVQNQILTLNDWAKEDQHEDKGDDRLLDSPNERPDLSPRQPHKPLEQSPQLMDDRVSSRRQRSKSQKMATIFYPLSVISTKKDT